MVVEVFERDGKNIGYSLDQELADSLNNLWVGLAFQEGVASNTLLDLHSEVEIVLKNSISRI